LSDDGTAYSPRWARPHDGFGHAVILDKRVYIAGNVADPVWKGNDALALPKVPPLAPPRLPKGAPPLPPLPKGLLCLDAETGVVTVRTLGGDPLGTYRDVHARRQTKARADVDYLLRRRRRDWQIIAIRIDGVDLARNFREQFQAVLERSSPDTLIAERRKRNAEREAENPWE
jgi:hypothetical protein